MKRLERATFKPFIRELLDLWKRSRSVDPKGPNNTYILCGPALFVNLLSLFQGICQTVQQKFQILSLDGGGIKGVFTAAVLAAVEEKLNVNIADHFDLIVGTSTGGIIALGLGMGLRPAEILKFYLVWASYIYFALWYSLA